MIAPDELTVRKLVEEFNRGYFPEEKRRSILKAIEKRNLGIVDRQEKVSVEAKDRVRVVRKGGLHWRPVADLIKLLNRHPDCEVVFATDKKEAAPVNGNYSILTIEGLAVAEGSWVEFRVKGDNEQAVKALAQEVKAFLSLNTGHDEAMNTQGPLKIGKKEDLGGIDLTSANMNLQTQNAGEGIKFHLDPAMLQRLQSTPGFVPVIINIQPLINLKQFLEA